MHYSIYILLGLAFALLALPCTLRLRLENAAAPAVFRLYLDGLVGWRLVGLRLQSDASSRRLIPLVGAWPLPLLGLSLDGLSKPRRRRKERPEARPDTTATKQPSPPISRLIRAGLYLLRHLKSSWSLRRCLIAGRCGLSDPAQTGQLYGCLQALQSQTGRRLQIHLEPDFTQPGLQGRLEVILHLHLAYLLFHLLLLILRLGVGRFAQRRPGVAPSLS